MSDSDSVDTRKNRSYSHHIHKHRNPFTYLSSLLFVLKEYVVCYSLEIIYNIFLVSNRYMFL